MIHLNYQIATMQTQMTLILKVTDQFKDKITYKYQNVASINFGDINKTYVVLVEGHYDKTGKT